MPAPTNRPLRYRQIHLDFHTSEHIPGIGRNFDPHDFVDTLKAAHVNSVTLFAKCHHGWSYYPTKIGAPHPELARPDLLGEMIEACRKADIETPIYLSVQWDERIARLHPEWRAMNARNHVSHAAVDERSALNQLSAAWHTLCLNHDAFRAHLMAEAREVLSLYETPGLFFDIIQTTDCVCPACLNRMERLGLDASIPADRLKNDEEVNERFRCEMSEMIRREFPGTRIFFNSGHINKFGKARYDSYSHLELESLPTGGWGYNHYPSSARYAAKLGLDFLGQTGKFHTSWGEFGGFKHPQALDYECALMATLGAKCLVGDQLHPDGRINRDTYRTIAPAYRRIAALEPFLEDAEQISEIAILSAEYFHRNGEERQQDSDDGAVQMLLELHRPFDVIDPEMDFAPYRLLILPDTIPVDSLLSQRLSSYVAEGGRLLLTGQSGLDPETGAYALKNGLRAAGRAVASVPSYVQVRAQDLDPRLPETPFVVYSKAPVLEAAGASVLASIRPSYFNRSFRHFSSHQHAPDDVDAPDAGIAAAIFEGIGTIAYPIFSTYRAIGQPLYKYLVDALISKLMPDPVATTSLPSSGRFSLVRQPRHKRLVAHLLYGAPQVRGQAVSITWKPVPRLMEMIEDVPTLGPVTLSVRVNGKPTRVVDGITGETLEYEQDEHGRVIVRLPSIEIHRAVVLEGIDT
jgi:hypothetical protein